MVFEQGTTDEKKGYDGENISPTAFYDSEGTYKKSYWPFLTLLWGMGNNSNVVKGTPIMSTADEDILLYTEAIHKELKGLTDSKKLSEKKRNHFFEVLTSREEIYYFTASSSAQEVDDINVLKATHLAMKRAAEGLINKPDLILVDGLNVPDLPSPAQFIIKGDSKSISIAAASVIAKVSRDQEMYQLAKEYPLYGFERHKGYGTKEHIDALKKYGPCPAHRFSFNRVSNQELF